MNKRFLNGVYAVEVLNGRLNTSCTEVENDNSEYKNTTFTKKINNKGYSSASSIKSSMKRYMIEQGENISQYIKRSESEKDNSVIIEANPYKNINEDVFGFMRAETITIKKAEYEKLTDEEKEYYEKSKKNTDYVNKATKKRDAKFKLNGLIGLGISKVKKEYGICNTTSDSLPYKLETYSDVMSGLFNFDVNSVGRYIVSNNEKQFRDYRPVEIKDLNIQEELTKEEREHRIEATLRALQYLSMESNQSNYLVDTTPKVIILGEYSWGNNVFQGVLNKNGINIEALKETIEDNKQFRLSKIWIGISIRIASEQFKADKKEIEEQLNEAGLSNVIEVGTIGQAFNSYIDYMKETLE